MSQGGPRAPTSLSWIIVLLFLTSASFAEDTKSLKNAKEVYVYSGTVSKPSYSSGFELLSTSDKHAKPSTSSTKRPAAAVSTTESPLAKEAVIAFPPSEKIEARPNHGSFIHFPSAGGDETHIIISSTVKPPDLDYGADILGEAIDQEAFGSTHHVISECDGDECCPGPHCTKDLICHHGQDCYYVPHKKTPYHYSTHQPSHYDEGPTHPPPPPPPPPRPIRDPPTHRPYNPPPKPSSTTKPNRRPYRTKTKTSSHYSHHKPALHQGTYGPMPSHHVTFVKPSASNVSPLKTKKPAPLKSGFVPGAIVPIVDRDIASTLEPRDGKKKHFKKLKKKKFLKKYLMPLLLAYKMLFMVLVPVMVKSMMMMISTSGMTGFFVALFGAAVTFHFYHSKVNVPPTSITLSSPPPTTEATKITKVIKYLPLPPPMMAQPMPMPPPPPQPHPQPAYGPPQMQAQTYGPPPHPTPPQYPEEPYGGGGSGGGYYPNYYQWMDRRRSKKRKKNNNRNSMLPNLSLFR